MAMAIILPILKLVAKKMLYQIGMWQENAKVIGKNSSFEKQIFSNHYLGYAKTNDENYKSLLIGEVATDASSLNKLIEQNIKENKEIIFAPILQGYDFTQAYIYNIFNSRINLIALQNSLQNRYIFNNTSTSVIDYYIFSCCFVNKGPRAKRKSIFFTQKNGI